LVVCLTHLFWYKLDTTMARRGPGAIGGVSNTLVLVQTGHDHGEEGSGCDWWWRGVLSGWAPSMRRGARAASMRGVWPGVWS
jgi:hypothetical protein